MPGRPPAVDNVAVTRMRWWMVAAAVGCVVAWAGLADAGIGGWAFAVYLLGLVPLGLGWLIAIRAPASPVSGALAGIAVSMLGVPALEAWAGDVWWVEVIWSWQVVGFLILLLVFPDGLLPGRRWRLAAAAVPLSALGVTT